MTLPYQLNKTLLFLQPHLFSSNKDSKDKALFWPLFFLGVLSFDELLEYNYRPKFIIFPHLIQQYKQMQLFFGNVSDNSR